MRSLFSCREVSTGSGSRTGLFGPTIPLGGQVFIDGHSPTILVAHSQMLHRGPVPLPRSLPPNPRPLCLRKILPTAGFTISSDSCSRGLRSPPLRSSGRLQLDCSAHVNRRTKLLKKIHLRTAHTSVKAGGPPLSPVLPGPVHSRTRSLRRIFAPR